MYLLNHCISTENVEEMPGTELHKYITFDLNVCDYFGENDKKVLNISFHLDEYIVEDNESSWHGRKSSHHVIDLKLKDTDDIYSIACALSIILDNGMARILEKINPRDENNIFSKKEKHAPVIEFPSKEAKSNNENNNKFDMKNYQKI